MKDLFLPQNSQFFILKTMYGNLLLYSLEKKENGKVCLDIVPSGKPFFNEKDDQYTMQMTEEYWQEQLALGVYKEVVFDNL
jgi:hypothetical protein